MRNALFGAVHRATPNCLTAAAVTAKPGRVNELVGFQYRLARRFGVLPAIALVALVPHVFPMRALAQTRAQPSETVAGPTNAKIAAVCNDIAAFRGPARYGAFRELWSLWEEVDPQYIEAALDGFRADPRLDAPSRAYASLLSAYARRRRGDIVGATSQVASLGYVHQWLVVGPFDNEGRAGLDRVVGPEQRMALPLDMQRAFDGKERQVRWRTLPDASGFGWIDMGEILRPNERVCAFAATFVRATDGQQPASRPRKATIWLGVTGAFRLFFNAEQVLSDNLYRTMDADRFATTVTLAPGWNQLVVKVCSDAQAPVLTLRIADAVGAPDKSLQASADPALAQQAALNAVQLSSQRPVVQASGTHGAVRGTDAPPIRVHDPGRPLGPVAQFDALVGRRTERLRQGDQGDRGDRGAKTPANNADNANKQRPRPGGQVSANALQAYANYLYRSGGDDPTQHLALDYATRAAEQKPTIQRYLLAAKLSQDRNQTREWLQKAEKLARPQDSVALLLAQARHARTGPNWREAVPFYDKALAQAPDNIDAILGRVDVYNEAGLDRSALAVLQQAVARNPRSVALLRMLALQLAKLGRSAEAAQVSERYAAYRFDDPTYLMQALELAVARMDYAAAQHWIDRLMSTEPYSVYHLGIVARAYIAMAKPDKAIAAYQHALSIAPEDTDTMVALSGLLARLGQKQQEAHLLRQVLALRPQRKDVREYLEHIEPRASRSDEAYAWSAQKFLPLRTAAAKGFNQRTLRDLQVTTVYPSGLSSVFRQVVFQPLTEEAAVAARQYAFAYQADREVVQMRAARVYRADGRVDEAIETGQGPADDPSIAMYTSSRIFYVKFPRLNVGDVVELRYRTEEVTPENVFADYFGQVVYMQSTEPVQNAEYVVIAPTSRKLLFDVSALSGLQRSKKTQGDRTIYRFFAPSVEPVLEQANMPPWSEVLGHVHVSTYQSWKDLGDWYWGLAKDQLHPNDVVRAKALELTKGLTTDADKVRAIYGWVVKRTRYVALEFGIYGFKPRPASQTLARGWGDCKDKATLLVSMLSVVGIPANLVIVRTAMRGGFPEQPASLAPFDHAIAYVPSLNLFLDGTADYTGSTELPSFDRDALAVIVAFGASKLVRIPDPDASQTERGRSVRVTLQPDASARLRMDYNLSGAVASQWRVRYHGENTRRDRIAADISHMLPGFVLDPDKQALESSDLEDIEQPVRFRINGKIPKFGRFQGDELSVPVTPPDRFVSRFASQSTRSLDVVLPYRSTIQESWTIDIPASMKVREMPQPTSVTTAFGKFSMDVREVGHSVQVKTYITLDKKRISAKQYPAFVKYCEQIDRGLNQRLTLVR